MSENGVAQEKLKRLQKKGETRWSKQAALERILGTFDEPCKGTYSAMIEVFFYIQNSPEFDAKATSDAEALLLKWLRFEIVFTPQSIQHNKACFSLPTN